MEAEKRKISSISALLCLLGIGARQEERSENEIRIAAIRNMYSGRSRCVGKHLAIAAVQRTYNWKDFQEMNLTDEEKRAFKDEFAHMLKQRKSGRLSSQE